MNASRSLTAILLICGLACVAPAAGAATYAPVSRSGPPLSVPRAQLTAALSCTPDVAGATRPPVLLVPGTALTPKANFSWNYERALSALKLPWCTIALPKSSMDDIQVAGEYVVYALRSMHTSSHRKVDIIGFSQGGMVPRWALRFWPGTRRLVDDDIGLDASNHGTLDAKFCDVSSSCPPAFWQQRTGANFLAALNSGQETFAGVSYTEIFSQTDEVVVPNLPASSSSSVSGGGGRIANIAVQSICPADVSDHLAMGSYDPVGYALAIDAITHPGPASAARVPATVCGQAFQPGVNPATFATDYAGYLGAIGSAVAASPEVPAEPAPKPYVFAKR
jgi:triacylglycerol esterase/lipase EstA (alpha/beta hydrolase family)